MTASFELGQLYDRGDVHRALGVGKGHDRNRTGLCARRDDRMVGLFFRGWYQPFAPETLITSSPEVSDVLARQIGEALPVFEQARSFHRWRYIGDHEITDVVTDRSVISPIKHNYGSWIHALVRLRAEKVTGASAQSFIEIAGD